MLTKGFDVVVSELQRIVYLELSPRHHLRFRLLNSVR